MAQAANGFFRRVGRVSRVVVGGWSRPLAFGGHVTQFAQVPAFRFLGWRCELSNMSPERFPP